MRVRNQFALLLFSVSLLFLPAPIAAAQAEMAAARFEISWAPSSVASWRYSIRPSGESLDIKLPVFEIDGQETPMVLNHLTLAAPPQSLRNGTTEYVYEGSLEENDSLGLQLRFRMAPDDPVVRFSYCLKASGGQRLTKQGTNNTPVYLSYSTKTLPEREELRLSVFNEMFHSCLPREVSLYASDFDGAASLIGPLILAGNGQSTFLCAYEHDSMYPNNFLAYQLHPDKFVELRAVKGNLCPGQPAADYETVWFELAGIQGGEESLADNYRRFVLKHMTQNTASRTPYIYYNTWGRQERVKWSGGQYLSTMNLDYTLREIDRAHEMGVEVYVLDAGWFDKTGDWGPHPKNFPDGFKEVRRKLDGYRMQLGVWMDPAKAAMSSRALKENANCRQTRNGVPDTPGPVWETEESTDMCLVSPYWEYYADVLVRLYTELGIRYFYLDGVGQSGCDAPGHFHGTAANSPEERRDSYGFLLPTYLAKIMEKVGNSCPDVIFDFDVTESGRIGVGLQFLASGRYFILNNGPYFHNFDLCPKGQSILPNGCRNIFIHPGPARTWFMRSVLDYDKWLPSNLFLANCQPDDPRDSQLMNLATLALGQNAIWGEILKTSPEGTAFFGQIIGLYKQVREDVAMASPRRIGSPGDTPEIYEKINPETGKGVVVVFANAPGSFPYVTQHAVAQNIWHNEGVEVTIDPTGHATIRATFNAPSAKIIFFGVD